MAVALKYVTPQFIITGDGVATSVDLSLFDYPFVNMPKRIPSSVSFSGGGGNIASAAVNGSVLTLTFNSAFSGDSSLLIVCNFDMP